jgi:hypothetical protein
MGEVRRGIVVLVLVVGAVIAWLALGPGPERHDGLTRLEAARATVAGQPDCEFPVRRVSCRPLAGHWKCRATLRRGTIVEASPAAGAHDVVVSFVC